MRIILIIGICIFIFGCGSNLKKTVVEDCGLEEMMTGISCVEPNLVEIAKFPLGSKDNPIKSDGPSGQREYLSRLVCQNGEPVSGFMRSGSVGIGPYGFMLDSYKVICNTHEGVVELQVIMDLYHKGYIENRVAYGFSDITGKM